VAGILELYGGFDNETKYGEVWFVGAFVYNGACPYGDCKLKKIKAGKNYSRLSKEACDIVEKVVYTKLDDDSKMLLLQAFGIACREELERHYDA